MSRILKNIGKSFFFRIILPTLLTIILFISTISLIIIPRFEESIMNGKRDMIAELTNSAYSILVNFETQVEDSLLSKEEAQYKAIEVIKKLRYGHENKDYFWITDEYPNMVMHPYRSDLNGKDLSDYQDQSGKKPFVEFVKIAKEQKEGYFEYLWQWKDDSLHVVPKLSFVKEFKKWNWIIGTGVYIDDVKAEMNLITNKLIKISLAISLIMALLLFFISQQSLATEKKRLLAENSLKSSEEKYKILVESATEGIIMIIDNKIAYSNLTIQNLTSYSSTDLENISLENIFFDKDVIENYHNINNQNIETKLITKENLLIEVKISLQETLIFDKKSLIISIKDNREIINIEKELKSNKEKFQTLFKHIDLGLFRTTFDVRGQLLEANKYVLELLGIQHLSENDKILVFDLITNKAERLAIIDKLKNKKVVKNTTIQFLNKNNKLITAIISLAVVKNKMANTLQCEGIIEDITDKIKIENEKDHFISELQNTTLFYSQPIKNALSPIVKTDYLSTINQISKILRKTNSDSIIVNVQNSENIGLITKEDIVLRAVAEDKSTNLSAFEIMTSPITAINENMSIGEVLKLMTNSNLTSVVTKNYTNNFTGIVYLKNLVNLHNNLINNILSQIKNSSTIDELKEIFNKTSHIVRPLIESEADIQIISNIISRISDSISKKLIEITIDEIGVPPVKFAFFVLGSEGRKEQTLATDQDNALLFEDVEDDKFENVQNYFMLFGEKLCNYLDFVGFDFCKGNIMAKNPKWNKPITSWKKYFYKWITEPNAENLLDISIFFDFKFIYGDNELFTDFSDFVNEIATQNSIFFFHLAQNASLYKAPIGIRGNIITDTSGKHTDCFDIKNSIIPVVMFSRIYSLKYKLNLSNTLERLNALQEMQIIDNNFYRDIIFNYRYLMGIRYKNQLNLILTKNKPDNYINFNNLLQIEQLILKKIFSQVSLYQQKLNLEFKGSFI